MILLRLRYVCVTVPLPSRYRPVTVYSPPLRTVTVFLKGYIPLPSVRDRDTIVTCVTERYMRYRTLHASPNVTCVTERYRTLQNVTERYRTLQNVTERYMRYKRYRALQNVT
jgi:hypothetical protein